MKLSKEQYKQFVLIKNYFKNLDKMVSDAHDSAEKEKLKYENQISKQFKDRETIICAILDYLDGDISIKQLKSEISKL